MTATVLLIACGALSHELVELQRMNQWQHVRIQCLPAALHNTPEAIPAAVREAIGKYRAEFRHIFIAYADCGTGGGLDRMLEGSGIERLPGAHCYEFFAGADVFAELADEEPGTFYLTDFLVCHFDRLVRRGLGLDRHPELRDAYFGNYRRVAYLSQSGSDELDRMARGHAVYLGLDYERRHTGLAPLNRVLEEHSQAWQN